MKTFYGETFLKITDIIGERIYCPIKIEYYKISQNKEYGIEIVKKMIKNMKIVIEKERVLNITKSRRNVMNILELLKRNQVLPINLIEIIEDLK